MNPVPRSCTELLAQEQGQLDPSKPQPLSTFRNRSAYVLLGDPGEGKTTSLKSECSALGDTGHWITARDFRTFGPKLEWQEKTLFIDGLDEIRAGQPDARTPLDDIRRHLNDLGKPRFRLSCRVADWLGANDRENLNVVSPNGEVATLRLEPLTDDDIQEIIKQHPGIDDAQAFLDRAAACGVEPLLRNPQNLQMLITAFVERGQLPDGRREAFEIACQQLVLEHNEEHNALPAGAPMEDLLDAAGRLCALQLIAGNAGFAIRPNAAANDYPDLRQVDSQPNNIARQVLASKLFSSPVEGRVEPSHRQIAEHLGGRYLAKCIDGGLPPSRIIALMIGWDGTVVTPLRGLSAWTAAHSPTARLEPIDRDPIGVGLYGDIRSFSLDEKRMLLRALQQSPITVRSPYDAAKAFGTLAAPGMEEALLEILTSPDRDDDAQWFTLFVLQVAAEGHPMPDLADPLMQVVRDDTRWSSVNSAALDAFMHCGAPEQREGRLLALLDDIRAGRVSDDRNELMGRLLIALYPKVVGPRAIWDYLAESSDDSLIGFYFHFWHHKLLAESSDEQVVELLDELVQRGLARRQVLEPHHLLDLPARLLARGLAAHGEQLDAKRLYSWLGVNVEDHELLCADSASPVREVGDWLREHPGRFKDILIEGLCQAPDSDEFDPHVLDLETRLHRVPSPSDFGLWYLEQAVRLDDARSRAARYLLGQAFRALGGSDGLSEALLVNRVAGLRNLKAHLERLLAPSTGIAREDRVRQRQAERQKQRDEWLQTVRSHRIALIENRAPPHILHQLARTYLETLPSNVVAKDGPARVCENLSGDEVLAQTVLCAFRGVIERDDVPAPDRILKLYRDGKLHFLSLPFLAGLAERERRDGEDVKEWPESRVQQALILRHCAHWGDTEPKWHKRLVECRPDEVAKAIVQIGVSELKRGKAADGLFWPLERDAAYGEVAKHACLPLLRGFPTRCRANQLAALDHLLRAAIAHADQHALGTLMGRKLSLRSMNPPQRIHWLAAARTAFGNAYQADLEACIEAVGDEHGVRHLVDFLSRASAASISLGQLGIGGTETLLRLIGGFCGPEDEFSEGLVTSVGMASKLSRRLIDQLAASSRKEASDALARLGAEAILSRWRERLRRAIDDQRAIRRDAEYSHPTINQVKETLNQGLPANAADLAAMVANYLRAIAKTIGNSNTDDWRQYWNLNSRGEPVKPKHEDACRDALLSDLRQRLATEVQAEPEGHQANDARADIVVTHNGLQVPVEAKKNQHRDLWSALRDQLIAKYAPDGPGIYLVFWFGSAETQLPPEGSKPKNPAELEERLMARLSSEERRRILVCVIDVGTPSPTEPPHGTSRSAHPA